MRGEAADDGELDLDTDLDDGGAGGGAGDTDEPAEGPAGSGRPGTTPRSRRRRTAVVTGAVVVLAVAALAVGSVVGRSADDADRSLFDGPLTAEGLFPVLDQEAEPGSGYPGSTLAASLGVVPSSPRPVGGTSTADFWVARTDDGRVCLLSRDTRDPDGLGGTCGTAAEAALGLRLPAGEGVSAVLLPPAADGSDSATALAEEGYAQAGDALWVDGGSAARTVEARVDAASDRTVVVPSGSQEGTAALPVFLTERDVPHAVVLECLRAARVDVAVARGAPQRVDCGTDAAFVPFEGNGGPVRVDVTAPPGLVWAAGVVRCEGSLLGPVC